MKLRLGIALLLVLGLGRMAADLVGAGALAAALGASGASPAPKVFSSVQGLETFSSRFFVEWNDGDGQTHAIPITSERYAGIRGPYNRRNVYGAAIAYGPVLAADARTRPLLASVSRQSLCGDATLLRELGIETPGRVGPVRIRVEPRQRPADARWPSVLQEDCR
jgi:hypothetical protein